MLPLEGFWPYQLRQERLVCWLGAGGADAGRGLAASTAAGAAWLVCWLGAGGADAGRGLAASAAAGAAGLLARRRKRADAGRVLAASTAAGAAPVCWHGAASAPMLEGFWRLVYWHGKPSGCRCWKGFGRIHCGGGGLFVGAARVAARMLEQAEGSLKNRRNREALKKSEYL